MDQEHHAPVVPTAGKGQREKRDYPRHGDGSGSVLIGLLASMQTGPVYLNEAWTESNVMTDIGWN